MTARKHWQVSTSKAKSSQLKCFPWPKRISNDSKTSRKSMLQSRRKRRSKRKQLKAKRKRSKLKSLMLDI